MISVLRPFRAPRVIEGKLTLPSSDGTTVQFAFTQGEVEFAQGQQVAVSSLRPGNLLLVAERPGQGDILLDSAREGVDFEIVIHPEAYGF